MEDTKTEVNQEKLTPEVKPKSDWAGINLKLTVVIKMVVIAILGFSLYAGVTTYSNYVHSGPACKINDFEYWLTQKNKGEIVSIHKARLQVENGTTQCFGTFKTTDGKFKDWQGSITELTNKDVIGKAWLN